MRGVGEVAADEHRPAAGLLDVARGLLGVVVLVEVGDDDVGALAGEGDRDRAADAAVGAGDDRRLAFEPPGPLVRALAVVGLGLEVGRRAGNVLLLGWNLTHARGPTHDAG